MRFRQQLLDKFEIRLPAFLCHGDYLLVDHEVASLTSHLIAQ